MDELHVGSLDEKCVLDLYLTAVLEIIMKTEEVIVRSQVRGP